jgi:hypothetical protein
MGKFPSTPIFLRQPLSPAGFFGHIFNDDVNILFSFSAIQFLKILPKPYIRTSTFMKHFTASKHETFYRNFFHFCEIIGINLNGNTSYLFRNRKIEALPLFPKRGCSHWFSVTLKLQIKCVLCKRHCMAIIL